MHDNPFMDVKAGRFVTIIPAVSQGRPVHKLILYLLYYEHSLVTDGYKVLLSPSES